MTKRKDSDGNSLNGNRRSRTASSVNVDHDVSDKPSILDGLLAEPSSMSQHMALWADHDGGYLKIRRGTDSPDIHLAWTWSIGIHAGKYVYVRTEYWRLLFGLEVLWQKVLEAEAGLRKPSPDKLRP